MSESTATTGADEKAYLWKYGFVIALLALAASFVFNIYDRIWKSGPEILATAAAYPFSMPPQPNVTGGGPVVLDAVANATTLDYASLHGYINLTARNAGDLDADNVRIQIRDRGFAVIEWDDKTTERINFQHEFSIGKLPIAKSFTASIWTERTISPKGEPPLIIHSTGSTAATFANGEPDNWQWHVLAIMSACGGAALATYFESRKARRLAESVALARPFPILDEHSRQALDGEIRTQYAKVLDVLFRPDAPGKSEPPKAE